ncbi:MAG TPA: ABC transporter permease [Longimicrobiales bacterium]|nr:ABC transporter permease [Longimicrobiales bacterium]
MPEWREEVRRRLSGVALGGAELEEVVEELAQHLDDRYAELRARGVGDAAAREATLAELAGAEVLAERVARARRHGGSEPVPVGAERGAGLAGVWADIRFGARLLRRNPAFALTAVLTLALGIGANAAIFSAVNAVVLRPLPVAAPGRLYMVWEENPEKGWHQQVAAPANYLDWTEGVAAFADVAAYSGPPAEGFGEPLTGVGAPRVLRAVQVTGNFFSVLGVKPELGRTLRPEETWRGGERVIVLSHRVWMQDFGGDRGVLGRIARVDGTPYRVVGVMPAGFSFPVEGADAWLPTGWRPAARAEVSFRRAHWLRVVARLRPGATAAEADAQLQAVVERLKRQYPETNRYMGAGMTPLHEFLVGDTRTPLLVLLGAVGVLLLIACANVGNLLLVKATGRRREIAVRRSLGAARSRIVRQMLTEGLLLALAGGAAGLLLGWVGTRLLERLQPGGLLTTAHFTLDGRVLAYIVAISTLSGLLFGAVPAAWTGRAGDAAVLREGGRTGAPGRGARRAASALVVAEVALALLLVVGAGLLVRSFWRLERVDPGFDARGVLTVSVAPPTAKYDTNPKALGFYRDVLERLGRLPGVSSVAATTVLPLTGTSYTSDYAVAGRGPDDYGTEVAHRSVTPGYLRAMGVPVLRGRGFTDPDRDTSSHVILINDVLARQAFPGQDPIGQRMTFDKHPDSTSTWRTVVGVVRGERQTALRASPQTEVYHLPEEDGIGYAWLVLRTTGDPLALAPAVRREVQAVDADVPVFGVKTMERVRAESLARERFLMTLLLVFAGVALVLAVVGVYGVTAQVARQRTQEIGLRIALGARTADVLGLVVRHGLRLIATGILLGVLAALLATRAMAALLYDVAPTDPFTFLAVALVLALTGVLASWLPARRAARTDPSAALRVE